MKRENVVFIGVIGLLFLGMIICAFGNAYGMIGVGGAIVLQANNI